MSEIPRRTLGSIREQRRSSTFVARGEELRSFRANLGLNYDDEDRLFIYNVTGQGGVGKTTLLHHMHRIVKEHWAVTAHIDETQEDVTAVLMKIADDFVKNRVPLERLSERCNLYRQRLRELESNPLAPRRTIGSVVRVLGTGAVIAGRRIPIAGLALDFVDEDAVGAQAEKLVDEFNEWKAFVKRNVPDPSEAELVLNPIEVLTPLLVEELHAVASRHLIALFFDTYERVGEYVDPWLRHLLDGDFGELPSEILIVIAGREPLEQNLWVDLESLIMEFALEPFSEEDARLYLARQGVTDDRTIEVILRLSGRLPLLLATLARESPDDPSKVGEAIGTAVERFLKWVEDPDRREVALAAALPRRIDRDTLSAAIGADAAQEHFVWLISNPFVQAHNDGWVYHSVVRSQMLGHQRRTSHTNWTDIHDRLAVHFESLRDQMELGQGEHWHEPQWRFLELEAAYHRLCQSPSKHISKALSGFLYCLSQGRKSARLWADTILSAGLDSKSQEVEEWGTRLQSGVNSIDTEDFPQAIRLFDELILQQSLSTNARASAYDRRAQLFRRNQNFDRALYDHDRALELDAGNVSYLLNRGWTHWRLKRTEDAANDFLASCQTSCADENLMIQRATALLVVDHLEHALNQCESALYLNAGSSQALRVRGQVYHQFGRYDEALADFNRAIDMEPDNAFANVGRAQLYAELNRYEEALADFNQAIDLEPNDVYSLVSRARFYAETKRPDEALLDYNRAIGLEPDNALTYVSRALLYAELARHDEALADFTQSIGLLSDNAIALRSRARLYAEMDRHDEAITDFNRAIDLEPDNAYALVGRAESYSGLNRYEEALADLAHVILLDPNNPSALIERALLYRQMDRHDEALADFNRAIALRPDSSPTLVLRAMLYAELQRHDEALADHTRAIALEPDNALALGGRVWMLMQLKRYEEAQQELDRLRQDNSMRDHSLLTYQGLLHSYLGNYAEALTSYHGITDWEKDAGALYNIAVVEVRWKGLEQSLPKVKRAKLALEALDEELERESKQYGLGGLEALAGNVELALGYLREAVSAGPFARGWGKHDIAWMELRLHPEFQLLVEEE